ncbi:NUDIX hydrolase [Candidatus Falkowbacteria bacterium]|nr:MAG: NUDIX hydrolase [Candidatus Falkowbacteria bacterium]
MKSDLEYSNLPKKRMGSGIILLNEHNEILLTKSPYKDYWTVPGGSVDENESPRRACIREIKEEIGLDILDVRFMCVDYQNNSEKGESLQFLFYGGILTQQQIHAITLQEEEISEYTFLPLLEAQKLLGKLLGIRIEKCLEAYKNNQALYLENAEVH